MHVLLYKLSKVLRNNKLCMLCAGFLLFAFDGCGMQAYTINPNNVGSNLSDLKNNLRAVQIAYTNLYNRATRYTMAFPSPESFPDPGIVGSSPSALKGALKNVYTAYKQLRSYIAYDLLNFGPFFKDKKTVEIRSILKQMVENYLGGKKIESGLWEALITFFAQNTAQNGRGTLADQYCQMSEFSFGNGVSKNSTKQEIIEAIIKCDPAFIKSRTPDFLGRNINERIDKRFCLIGVVAEIAETGTVGGQFVADSKEGGCGYNDNVILALANLINGF
jgi:hypothetical protein